MNNEACRTALENLLKGIDRVMPTLNSACTIAYIHGIKYTPEQISIEKEIAEARKALEE